MKSNKFTVDRFEGELAVLLQRDDEAIEKLIAKAELTPSISEGDLVLITFDFDGNVVESEILTEETEQARLQALELVNKLKNKNN